jgi:hypothetical protein
VSAGL